ncbi:F-box domain [Arabidopsis thaliana x Arabidopsis arenosa]|uniref:F-box domain n=1 Tax=Arabidopsis thaliana x Arabidopsis arenosa TaxID=1240361 RepID=A0A8T2ATB1_9BRAS|nr:F-box domain [Arabidopsis thaliana x Arabidopsis arenosa]
MMEKQEEEEVKRRRVCSSSSLPLDPTLEILLRLPAKSLVRSRCVSKLWSSFTTLPCFINSFAARSSQSPCLLIFAVRGDNIVVFFLPEQRNSDKSSSSSSPVGSYLIKDTKGYLLLVSHQFSTRLVLLSKIITARNLEPNHEAVLNLNRPRRLLGTYDRGQAL